MKFLPLLCLLLLGNCTKNEKIERVANTEDPCFILNEGLNDDTPGQQANIQTPESILKNLPEHLKYTVEDTFTPFTYDRKEFRENAALKEKYFASHAYHNEYRDWIAALPEFRYVGKQAQYALALNRYGYWLVENNGGNFKPYFLGLPHTVFISRTHDSKDKFIEENSVVLPGVVLKVERLSSVPLLPKYEVVKDGLRFTLDLAAVTKDSDGDGFNDLFENFIGLNALSEDTDKDGIKDFEDPNPRFKSGSDKFTAMYEHIIHRKTEPQKYSFTEILTNCPFFHQIQPRDQKVLIYSTAEKVPLMEDVLDTYFPGKYSKMKTYKNYPEVYFTDFSDKTGDGTFSAEFKDGQWKIDRKYSVTFGM